MEFELVEVTAAAGWDEIKKEKTLNSCESRTVWRGLQQYKDIHTQLQGVINAAVNQLVFVLGN